MKSVKLASLLLASGMLLGSVHAAVTPAYTAHAQTESVQRDASKVVTLTGDDVNVVDGIITELINEETATKLWNDGELVIPEKIDSETITGIGDNVFSDYNLRPDSVTSGTKGGITKLTFTVPENITSIGNQTFFDNQLTSINLPKVETIGNAAFAENMIEGEMKLPEVTNIGNAAFYRNALTGINLPKNPTLDGSVFGGQRLELTKSANEQGEVLLDGILSLSVKIGNANWTNKSSYASVRKVVSGSVTSSYGKIQLDKNEPAEVILAVMFNDMPGLPGDIGYSVEELRLTIEPATPSPTTPPTNGGNENNTSTTPDTNPDSNTPDTSNNETPIAISPDPDVTRPHTVYAKRAMRLHSNVSLTNPTKSYKKQSRAKATSFRIQGVSYDKNGKKRYKVNGGYITASSKYVADSHFRSSKVKQVRVIGNKVNSYKDAKLSKSQQVRSYKKGTKLKVNRIVKQGRTTRFQLNNGHYITGNKQLLIMDHSK